MPLSIEDLNRLSPNTIQNLKDLTHSRILINSTLNPATGCLTYSRSKHCRSGIGVIKIASATFSVSRAIAWINNPNLSLSGPWLAVRSCQTPGCCNPDHIKIATSRSHAWILLWKSGVWPGHFTRWHRSPKTDPPRHDLLINGPK